MENGKRGFGNCQGCDVHIAVVSPVSKDTLAWKIA